MDIVSSQVMYYEKVVGSSGSSSHSSPQESRSSTPRVRECTVLLSITATLP